MRIPKLFLRIFLGEALVGMISVLVVLLAVAGGEGSRVFDSSSLLGWLRAIAYGALLVVVLSAWMAVLAVRPAAASSDVQLSSEAEK